MPPPSLTQWKPVGLAVPAPFLRADGAEAMSSLARLIASGAVSSRTDLAKRTGLARSTIGVHLDRLQAAGLIREAGIAEPSGRGRPAHCLELAPDSGVVLVADLGVHGARLAVADLGQRPAARHARRGRPPARHPSPAPTPTAERVGPGHSDQRSRLPDQSRGL